MAVDTTHSILRSARSFFAGTSLSRVSGLLRDVAMGIAFGSSPEIAAFMVSYRLANLFRRLLGEGNLQAGFVPHFVSLKEEGGHFFRDATYSLGLILILVIALSEALLYVGLQLASPDWVEIIELTMWMLPGLFFICLYGLNSSLLQCQKRYFLPAVAPVVFNFIWIAAVLSIPNVKFLSLAVTVAFAGQWLMTFGAGARLISLKDWLKPRLFSPDFRALLKPLLLGIVGIGAVQFNSALDAIFARIADLQGPAFLWYAIRIQQLPLALFGIALSGALLPPLSRTENREHRKELLQSALKTSALLMLVCTFGIFTLGSLGVNLIYGHGTFTNDDVKATADCLSAYGMGLVPSVFVLLLAARCYAEKNYRRPMVASLVSVGVNTGLNALFVFGFGWGAISIAMATSISSIVNAILLANDAFTKEFWVFFCKALCACLIAASATQLVSFELSRSFTLQVVHLAILSAIYLIPLLIFGWMFGLKRQIVVRRSQYP